MPSIQSTLSGRVVEIHVKPGDQVTPGKAVVTLESMKMEIPLESEIAGVVSQVLLAKGDDVNEGQTIVVLD